MELKNVLGSFLQTQNCEVIFFHNYSLLTQKEDFLLITSKLLNFTVEINFWAQSFHITFSTGLLAMLICFLLIVCCNF